MLNSIPFILAALLGVAIPGLLLLIAHLARLWSDGNKLVLVMCTMVLTPALGAAVSGRVLSTEREVLLNPALATIDIGAGLSPWINRLGTLVLLGLCLAEVLRWLLGQRTMPAAARTTWLAAMAYYFVIFGLAGLAGDSMRFVSLNLLYVPILFTALALYANAVSSSNLRILSWTLRFVFVASLIGAVIAPTSFTNRDYASLIPGLNWRLVGLTDHANSLGALALVGLMLEMSKQVWRRPQWPFVALTLVVLAAAQSKTAWVGTIAITLMSFLDPTQHRPHAGLTNTHKVCMRFCWLVAGIAMAYGVVSHFDALHALDAKFAGYTGRDRIWDVTMMEFERNPFLGYGPALWDMQYRMEQGMPYVGQSHNQFMQTLGQAGLIGIGTLAIYLGLIFWRSLIGLRHGLPLPLLCVTIILIRCQMETPLQMNSVLSADALVHTITFLLVSAYTIDQSRIKKSIHQS